MNRVLKCPRCERALMGSARTCVVHGDQVDVGGHPPALETVADQLRRRSVRFTETRGAGIAAKRRDEPQPLRRGPGRPRRTEVQDG